MRQGKDAVLILSVIISVLMLFSATGETATDRTSCIVGGNGYQIEIDNTAGQFPFVITDKSVDLNNYCGNTSDANYPCSVFRYKIKRISASGPFYNHLYYTIPYCPNNQLNVLKSSPALTSSCGSYTGGSNSPFFIENCGLQMGKFNAVNSNGIDSYGSPSQDFFYVPVQGDVGFGVNSLFLYDQSSNTYHPCSSIDPTTGRVEGGILGPGCFTPSAETCDPPVFTSTTTNMCLPNLNGKVVKLDIEGRAIKAIYECPNPTCIPAEQCVKQETYEVEVAYFDEYGNPLYGGHAFQVMDVGGTVEEAVGYFVVSEGDPTIYCLSGVGGNTICVCSGSKCPQQ